MKTAIAAISTLFLMTIGSSAGDRFGFRIDQIQGVPKIIQPGARIAFTVVYTATKAQAIFNEGPSAGFMVAWLDKDQSDIPSSGKMGDLMRTTTAVMHGPISASHISRTQRKGLLFTAPETRGRHTLTVAIYEEARGSREYVLTDAREVIEFTAGDEATIRAEEMQRQREAEETRRKRIQQQQAEEQARQEQIRRQEAEEQAQRVQIRKRKTDSQTAVLLEPGDGRQIYGNSVKFTSEEPRWAESSVIEISRYSDFRPGGHVVSEFVSNDDTDDYFVLSTGNLSSGTYYWRIRSGGIVSIDPYKEQWLSSEIRSFIIN